jgi:hypothetical protein
MNATGGHIKLAPLRRGGLLLLIVCALAACSSSKSTSTPTTVAPTTVPPTTTPIGTAAKGDAFCIAAAGAVHAENSVNLATGSVASVKSAAAQAIAGVLAARKAAPPDIRAEWSKLVADLQEFKQVLAANGYDVAKFKASSAGNAELNNPDWARTFQAIDDYLTQKCGVTP